MNTPNLLDNHPPVNSVQRSRNDDRPVATAVSQQVDGQAVPSPKLQAAQAWADRGFAIFPLKPNTKNQPLTANGHNGASRDATQIVAWWTEHPDANIGYVPGSNGCGGVDLDRHKPEADGIENWEALLAEHGAHPPTLIVRTPSDGRHLLFRDPGRALEANSVGKLGPGIDTRGSYGYLVAPGSVIDGKPYEVAHDAPIAELPAWVSGKLEVALQAARVRRTSDYHGALDTDPDIKMGFFIIQEEIAEHAGHLPIVKEGSDERAYKLAARLLDWAITEGAVVELLRAHWAPHFDLDWLQGKVANAIGYRINEQAIKTANIAEAFKPIIDKVLATITGPLVAMVPSRFKLLWPDEFEAMPDLGFWDDEKTLLRSPDGAICILGAEYSQHKTNVVLTKIFDAVERGARVLYAAGEGAHGVGKHRIPAHCKARGITTASLRRKLGLVRGVPLFASSQEVQSFIEEHNAFNPDIVVLDTLATATAGQDENGPIVSSFLTDNGAAGLIKRAFGALVILLAHFGKDPEKGLRGHSGQHGNVDTLLFQYADDSGAIRQHVQKMRDGVDGFDVYFNAWPQGRDAGVPVPVKITEDEYNGMIAKGSHGDESARGKLFADRRDILLRNQVFSFEDGWPTRRLAEALVNSRARVSATDPQRDKALLATAIAKEIEGLKNAARSGVYKDVIAHRRYPDEAVEFMTPGKKMELRWYMDDPQQPRGAL
jgi:hypothetical protein